MGSRFLAVMLLIILQGCSQPSSGVLTLAPAGMRFSEGCMPNDDGTLEMPAGSSAEQIAYFEAGTGTVTLTARLLGAAQPVVLHFFFEGDPMGTVDLTGTEDISQAFRVSVARSGPHSMRLEVAGRPNAGVRSVHFEKLVSTQP